MVISILNIYNVLLQHFNYSNKIKNEQQSPHVKNLNFLDSKS